MCLDFKIHFISEEKKRNISNHHIKYQNSKLKKQKKSRYIQPVLKIHKIVD